MLTNRIRSESGRYSAVITLNNKARAAILGVLKGLPGSTSPGSTLPASSLVLGRECLRRAGELVARELVHWRTCKCTGVYVNI